MCVKVVLDGKSNIHLLLVFDVVAVAEVAVDVIDLTRFLVLGLQSAVTMQSHLEDRGNWSETNYVSKKDVEAFFDNCTKGK
jgi:hypothetical protein